MLKSEPEHAENAHQISTLAETFRNDEIITYLFA